MDFILVDLHDVTNAKCNHQQKYFPFCSCPDHYTELEATKLYSLQEPAVTTFARLWPVLPSFSLSQFWCQWTLTLPSSTIITTLPPTAAVALPSFSQTSDCFPLPFCVRSHSDRKSFSSWLRMLTSSASISWHFLAATWNCVACVILL